MSNHFRIRAFVDGQPEERIVIAETHAASLKAFGDLKDDGFAEQFKDYPIFFAMVHSITFDETGPVYTDVTAVCRLTDNGYKRASFEDCLKFFPKKG